MNDVIIQPVAMSVAIPITALYITIKISVITAVGDLQRIRSHAIYQIAKRSNPAELLNFISELHEEGKVLLFSPENEKSNKPLSISFAIFVALSLASIFGPIIAKATSINEVIINLVYSASISALLFWMWYDFQYYKQYKNLEKRYPIPADYNIKEVSKIIVKHEP